MTKTAEERAREIADRAMRSWDVDADAWLVCVAEEIADALRQTERAVWLSAAEVADKLPRSGEFDYDLGREDGAAEVADMLRRRAEEV